MTTSAERELSRLLALAGDRCAQRDAAALSLRFPTLHALLTAPAGELTAAGIGRNYAVFLNMILPAARKCRREEYEKKSTPFRTADEIGGMLREVLRYHTTEVLTMASFDREMRLVAITRLAEGSVSEAPLLLRTLAEAAVKTGAAFVAVAHNHPDGTTEPSDADLFTTEQMQTTLSHLGVPLLEHFVVTEKEFRPLLLTSGASLPDCVDPETFYSRKTRQQAGLVYET